MDTRSELQATVDAMVQPGKGLLAADESGPTIAKRFKTIGIDSTEENRRAYRNLLLTTPGLGEFVSGVILYQETLGQKADDGTPFPQLAARNGIVPGIKVDLGKIALAHAPGDEITEGLDGLARRFVDYKQQGARFAKWRAVYNITANLPSRLAIEANADSLARYAAISQEAGIVPIVEPEVLMDGDHSIERSAEVTEAVLHEVFDALRRHRVVLEHILLKPSMVLAGSENARQSSTADNAAVAFLVMTAEDETAEGQMQARMNVIHEAGLFQGRLGFTRAIVLLEEGCEEFSNISGLGQIRFPQGNIAAAFEEIRRVLEREGLIQ